MSMNTPKLPPCNHRPKPYEGPPCDEVLRLKSRYLTPTAIPFYNRPLMIVEGAMQYLFDEKGRRYLDAIGGIVTISVGHCHPYVVRKVKEQMERLQHVTSIYLHPNVAGYAEMLAGRLPGELSVCYFMNSGSEANDMALLMARLYNGNTDVIALQNAYHGGGASTMQLTANSAWKYNTPQHFGVHHAINPNPYRGPWGYDDPDAGSKYAAEIRNVIDYTTPGRVAAFIAESIQGVGGAVVYPEGFLKQAYGYVREAGGLCIADEVQTGFTRTGTHYWGFENHGVIPDIVTMAKGIGNGVPLAAVVTTPAIAAVLTSRIHFNTFGGNPVSCAAGMAVLEVIDRENLRENALERGRELMEGYRGLMARHEVIGDVRGRGLMTGIELVKDRRTKEPDREACLRVFERVKDLGLLAGKGGLHSNTLRIKPPLCITREDVAFLLEALDVAIGEL